MTVTDDVNQSPQVCYSGKELSATACDSVSIISELCLYECLEEQWWSAPSLDVQRSLYAYSKGTWKGEGPGVHKFRYP